MSKQPEQFRMLIGGKAVDAISGRTFESENPYTGQPWAVIPGAGPEDVDAAVQAARSALDGEWGQLTGFGRARLMRLLADLISVNAERLARLEVQDSGKLYREMIGQLNGLGDWYHYYAGLADKLEGKAIVLHDPPAGYRRPRPRIPLKDRQRKARQDWFLMRVTTVVLVVLAAAMAVIIVLMITGFH